MANYYVDKNGDITLGKKKKKFEDNDIAPVKTSAKTKASAQKNNDVAPSWLEKGAFADGYDFGDITKTILGTGYDITKNLTAGVLGMGEKAVDANALAFGKYSEMTSGKSPLAKAAISIPSLVLNPFLGAAAIAGSFDDNLSEKTDEFVKKDLYDENKVADYVAPLSLVGAGKLFGIYDEEDSVLGSKSDSLVQSAGQLGATAALQAVGVPWWATTAITSFGGEVENALNQGATKEEAMLSGAISAGAEILTEKLFGGIKFPGMGTLDDGLTKMLARGISNKAVRTLAKLGIDVVGEGGEEVLSGLMSAIGQKLTYADEQELNELFSSEDAWESFIGGAVLGGAGGAVQATGAKVQGRDYASGLTANEEAVVRKIYEAELAEAKKNGTKVNKNDLWDSIVNQMDRGEISIDTIEEVLGGDEYTAYKNLIDEQNAHLKDLAKMFEGDELKAQTENYLSDSKRGEMKSQLGKNVFGRVITEKGSRLLNSYAEMEARGKKFTANLDDYEGEYAKKTIQNIIDAESGNNTRRMHELADLLAKTSEDKKKVFSITDAKKLAGTSFAFKDQTTDGYVVRDADGVVKEVVINLDSPKYLNRVVGHEVTHILEGTEFYDTFRGVVEEYARSKGEYDTRLADTIRRYSDKDGYKGQAGLENIKKEVVADLVGDYIFSDAEFVKNLSVKNRNIFEKVYDEIKYFCKVAKAGSKEEKQLLKAKKAFEDAYRAEGVKKGEASTEEFYDSSTKYSLRVTDKDTLNFLDNQETVTTYKTMQLVDGKLYPPMASRIEGKFEDYSELGVWEQATEHPELIKNGNKFKLDKGKGQGSIEAAYNPYMHSSNLVLNDQFSGAYKRDNLVTVECEVPASELTSGYHAEFAKDSVGWHPWHTGTVAGQLRNAKGTERQVLLSRWIKPVRIVPDSEVAAMYKELLDGTEVEVPDNVVTPSLLNELKNAGVKIKKSGRMKYSISNFVDSEGNKLTETQGEYFKDSKIRDENGNLKVVYHGSGSEFTVFSYDFMSSHGSSEGQGFYFTDSEQMAKGYQQNGTNLIKGYLDIKKPLSDSEITIKRNELSKLLKAIDPTGDDVLINYDPTGGMGYPSKAWYNRALAGTVDSMLQYNSSDSEILADIANSGAGTEAVLSQIRGLLGYDGYIVKGKYDGADVYVAFESNQFKNIDNQNPTADPDIRYSLSEAGLDYDAKSGTVSYSLTSLNDAFAVEKGVEEYQAARKEHETALAKSIAEDPENITDEEKAKASRYLDNLFLIGEMIANDRERLDYEAAVNKSAWVSNSEYGGSIDFSTLCAKRRIFTGTFDAIQEALPDTILTENDFLTIRNLLLESGEEAPCSMCYVEGSRAKHGLYVAKFITDYKKTNPEWIPQIADFASSNRLEQTRLQHPEAYKAYQDAMNKLSQRKPKEASVRTDYKGEILRDFANSTDVAQKNLNGGVRFNSFSDFEIIHALDCMQVLTDMSRVGLNGQAYTKVADFAEAFGNTGLKINLSLVAKDVDENGNLIFDEVNGMKYSEANDLRNRYSENVGTVIVVFNEAQLKAALADSTIDYVLPFHRSQWKKAQYDSMGLPEQTKDFTAYQNDKVKNPKSGRWVNLGKIKHKATYTNDITGETYEITGNIMPNQYWDYNASGRENAQRYLDYINSNGLAPKFYFLLDNVDGKWVLPEGEVGDGYFKLLIDFKMYNNEGWGSPQKPVTPEFNMSHIQKMLDDYKGGHKSFPVAQGVVDKFVAGKKKGKYQSYPEQIAPSKVSMPKFNMPDSMAMSLSEEGVAPVKHSATEISGADVRLQTPVAEVAPVAETADVAPAVDNTIPEGFTPVPERVANEQQTENVSTIKDADAPAEVEPSAPEQTTDVSTPRNPFEQRDYTKVGSTKTKSFVEENPDAQPLFQEAAQAMLEDLRNSQKGHRWYNDRLYHESGGENGLGGVQRETTQDIADLLDGQYHYSYQQIDDALNFIIHGEKLNACAKRIEFALNDRLMNGYTDVYGNNIPPNQDYINLLNQMQTAEDVNRQGSGAVFTDADVPVTDVAPSKVAEAEEEERLAQERRSDPKANEGSWWSRTKKTINDAITLVGDKGWAIENLSKKTGNRAVEALYDFYRNRTKGVSQEYINERLIPMWEEIEKTGKLSDFSDYARHLLNIDRMSLETAEETARRAELKKLLDGYNEKQIERIASERITRKTPEERKNLIQLCQEYVELGGEKGKNKPVFGYSMTAERSRQKVAEYEANNPEFKEWEAEILAYNKALRDFAVSEGLISKKTAELWAKMYPHYVPILRTDKNGVSVSVPLDTRKTGVNSPFKRAKGGNSDFEPLFETMANNTEQIFRAAHRNRFGIELMDTLEASYMVDANKSTDKKTRQAVLSGKIPAGTRVKAFDRNNIGTINSFNPKTGKYNVHFEGERGTADAYIDARLIAPLGKLRQTIAENADSDANEILGVVEENDGAILKKGENGMPASFTVFVKGKRVEFDISEEIFNAVKPTNETLAKTFAPSNWLADKYKKLLTEYNPVFAFWRNPIKDTKDVFFNSQHAVKTYLNAPAALHEMFSKGEGKYIREYLQNGGKTNTYYDSKTKTFVKKKKGIARKVVGFPVHAYQTASENIEMFWRLAEYIASRKEGRSIEVSMLDAARVTTNFGAGGDLTKFFNRNGAMFLNPSVQGAMQIGRNVREAHHQGAKGYAILAAKVLGVGLSGLVLNHLLWDDDEEYEELSDYVKQNYFIIAKTKDGKFIRIPKGRMEAVIQYGFEQMENLITGDDEVDMETFAELVVNNLAPNNPFENNLTSPLKQVAENKTWYGEDLVPQRLQDLPANEQYDETTDEISKWFANTGVGKMLNVSPYKMNYLMQQYGGGLADTVLPMLTPEAENGSDSLLGNMIAPWKDEFVSDGVLKNQNVSDFYDLKDKLTINANASTATDEDYLKSSYMNAINSELSELYAQKREIQNNTYLSDKEKYAKVREIQQEIVDLTREAMNSYEDVNIQGTYATVGDVQYRYYTPGEDSTAEPGWRKLSAEQIEDQNKVTRGLGISASEYWSNKEEYDYAYEKPEKYAVAKSVGGYKTFRNVSSELYDIKADKDSSGKSISGSRKEKVIDYINGLDLDYGEKIILFKNEYNADDTYNWEIIEYLNGRSDISYKEMETILKELGFTVHSDGRITWD